MARPTKFTPETISRLVEGLSQGNTRAVSCKLAGITVTVFCKWMKLGKADPASPYAELVSSVEKAEAEATARMVARVMAAADTSWQAAAWYLERKYPESWSRDSVHIRNLERQVAKLEKMMGVHGEPGEENSKAPEPDGGAEQTG